MNRNTRLFLVLFGRPFLRRLAWPLALLLFVTSQADATVNWGLLRQDLASRDPWQVALLITVLFLCWGIAAGRALRAVWRQPVMAFLVRQPLTRLRWVRCLAPSLSLAFLPVAGFCWLLPHYAPPAVHYPAFVGLAWPIVLGASYHGTHAVKWVAIGGGTLAALFLACAYEPAIGYVAFAISLLLMPLSVSALPEQVARLREVRAVTLASRSPVFAIVRRDLLYLWRMEPTGTLGLVWVGAAATLMLLALRINGGVTGREAFVCAAISFSFAVMPVYELLERTKKTLGAAFLRRRWPIDHRQRGTALMYVTIILTAPALVALTLAGATMGMAYLLLFILYAATTLAGLAALFSVMLAQADVSPGWSLLLLTLHTGFAVASPSWTYGLLAALALPLGCVFIDRRLRTYVRRQGGGI